jgi:hypothetical protein
MNKKSAGILLMAFGIPILLACIVGFNNQKNAELNSSFFTLGCSPNFDQPPDYCERTQGNIEANVAGASRRLNISIFLLLATAATGVTLISLGRKEDTSKDESSQE